MMKPDPERIYLARRAATFRRIVDEDNLDEYDAAHWTAGWEREAETRGTDRHSEVFRREGSGWIVEQRPRK